MIQVGISSEVKEAMASVPRARFVPEQVKSYADADEPLPIGFGQTISQPTVVGIMTTALELTKRERVLEIGTGSGFQTAILARLAQQVYSMEVIEELSLTAQAVLRALDIQNIEFRIDDGYKGWPDQAPFDRIICTAAPPKLPKLLSKQLAVGGLMIAPIGRFSQDLLLYHRTKEGLEEQSLGGVRFVPMVRK